MVDKCQCMCEPVEEAECTELGKNHSGSMSSMLNMMHSATGGWTK